MHNIKITDVRALPGDSAFLLDDGETAVLYDTGFAFTGYAVADKIKKALGERPLDYIFLTHSHYDHALGSVYVKRRYPDAKIVAGEYAAKIFAKPTARAVMREMDRKFAVKCGVGEYEDLIDDICADVTVADGDVIQAGKMHFTAVGFPGHTRCSVGYYLAENKLLLGSETLGVYAGDGIVVPSCLVGCKITLDSIRKALEMDIESVLVPHFGLLEGEDTQKYLYGGKRSTEDTLLEIVDLIRIGKSDEDVVEFFREKFYHGYVKEIYPSDAMELNTKIMIGLVHREILGEESAS